MSYRTQKIANDFPSWATARFDPSSLFQRLLSLYAEATEDFRTTWPRLKELSSMLTKNMDLDFVNYWDVELTGEHPRDAIGMPITPSVIATTTSGDAIELKHTPTLEGFKYSPPSRLIEREQFDVNNWNIAGSGDFIKLGDYSGFFKPANPINLKHSERLGVSVKDSDIYLKWGDRNTPYSGNHKVYIYGKDINNILQKEQIRILDDGYYLTNNAFSEVSLIEYEGFDGDVEIQISDAGFEVKKHNEISGHSVDIDRALYFRLSYPESGAGSYLESIIPFNMEGVNYRDPGSNELDEDQYYILASQWLIDESGNDFTAIDFCISAVDSMIYAIDEDGKVCVYKPSLSEFTSPNKTQLEWEDNNPSVAYTGPDLSRTKLTSIVFEPISYRAILNEEMRIYTWHKILDEPIKKVTIFREDPDGVIHYLQSDKTWDPAVSYFSGAGLGSLPEESWKDFYFLNEFDKLGQWNFFIKTEYLASSKPSQFFTSIYCEYLKAIKSDHNGVAPIETGISNAEGIFWNFDGALCIKKGNSYTGFDIERDTFFYLPDTGAGDTSRVFVRDDYESVEVSWS